MEDTTGLSPWYRFQDIPNPCKRGLRLFIIPVAKSSPDRGLDIPATGRCRVGGDKVTKRAQTMKTSLTIGEVAREFRLNPRTIRYYEEFGVLPQPRRSESGYRLYSSREMERLRLIRRAKFLGLSLAEIKQVVEYAMEGRCEAVQDRLSSLVEAKLGEIDQKIQELVVFRDDLRRYRGHLLHVFESGSGEECESPALTTCQCLSEEMDTLGKNKAFHGPVEAITKRKETATMANKGKKEPKATTPQKDCGCGCLPVKK
ncbi:MAG: MerR family transcriptional regulator [Chloroflexi bacterium]|nr:MerR family transcriptional regulator [Chloroflexota bacterium]